MCDAYTPAGEPIPTNKRHAAAKIFSHPEVVAEEPWYLFIYFLIHHHCYNLLPLFSFFLLTNYCYMIWN